MTTTPKRLSARSCFKRILAVADPRGRVGKADAGREEMGECTARAAGGQVQASRERYAEITLGTSISQQGLAATCKDPLYKAEAEVGGRDLVGRMSLY
jgi:hypothetical protein